MLVRKVGRVWQHGSNPDSKCTYAQAHSIQAARTEDEVVRGSNASADVLEHARWRQGVRVACVVVWLLLALSLLPCFLTALLVLAFRVAADFSSSRV